MGNGDDYYHGGGGIDIAVVSGVFEDYQFLEYAILHLKREDGSREKLNKIEYIEFEDGGYYDIANQMQIADIPAF